MTGLVCPTCPLCGSSPDDAGLMMSMISGGAQVICPNGACEVFMWDGTQPDGGLSDAAIMEEIEMPTDGAPPFSHWVSRPRDATPDEIDDAIRKSGGAR